MLKKEMRLFNNKKYYLLGKRREDGRKVWLEESSWDCDWYWGFGYVEIFSYKYKDIDEHTHFDSLFLHNILDSWKEYFEDSVLEEKDIYALCDIMKLCYTIRNYSDILHRGAGISSNTKGLKLIYENDKEYDRINKEVLPKLFNEVYTLLS